MEKILVIEDNPEVRDNIKEILELSGYEVMVAEDGKVGINLAVRKNPDLIVCDVMMPELDGYGVLHALNKRPETRAIPFIFLTAKSDKQDIRKGMSTGADDYITKPFEGIELLDAVESRLKKVQLLNKRYSPVVNDRGADVSESVAFIREKILPEDQENTLFPKGHELFKEGQRPRFVYFVLSGKIKLFKSNDDGKELIVNILRENELLGYLPVLEGEVYKESAQVLEDAEVVLISGQKFTDLIFNDMQLSGQMIRLLVKDISGLKSNLVNQAYSPLRMKVAYGLAKIANKYKESGEEKVILDLSRKDMASAVGIATESLIRTLGDFKSEGLIDIKDSKVVIPDIGKLASLPF